MCNLCEILCCLGKCCYDATHLCYDSNNFIASKIAEVISNNPLGSFELDTVGNTISMNWSSLSRNERKQISEICKSKIYNSLKNIENNKIKILKTFTDNDINDMIYFIGHQINFNLKSVLLNYFKDKNDETKYKYTEITNPKRNIFNKYENIRLPTLNSSFKTIYTDDFLNNFLEFQNKSTKNTKMFSKITTNKADYELLHNKYFSLIIEVFEENNDYEHIILDSFIYFDKEKQEYQRDILNNKDYK